MLARRDAERFPSSPSALLLYHFNFHCFPHPASITVFVFHCVLFTTIKKYGKRVCEFLICILSFFTVDMGMKDYK